MSATHDQAWNRSPARVTSSRGDTIAPVAARRARERADDCIVVVTAKRSTQHSPSGEHRIDDHRRRHAGLHPSPHHDRGAPGSSEHAGCLGIERRAATAISRGFTAGASSSPAVASRLDRTRGSAALHEVDVPGRSSGPSSGRRLPRVPGPGPAGARSHRRDRRPRVVVPAAASSGRSATERRCIDAAWDLRTVRDDDPHVLAGHLDDDRDGQAAP